MARSYSWPREQWWRCTLRADGRRGWCKRERINDRWVYTYWDGIQTERRYVGGTAAGAELVSERDANGELIYESEQRCTELTALQVYHHRD